MEHSSTPLLSWEAQIHPHHTRGFTWKLAIGTIISLLIIYSISEKSWSFTTVIVMFSTLYWFIHRKPPVLSKIEIFNWGFSFDGKHVEWEVCTGFWFLEGPAYHELHIEHGKRIIGDFVIQTGEKQIEEIHEVLKKHIEELQDRKERKLDTISRLLKI